MPQSPSLSFCLGLGLALVASCADPAIDDELDPRPAPAQETNADEVATESSDPAAPNFSECQGDSASYACLEGVSYGAHELQSYDLWLPNMQEDLAPLVVYVHGGGYFQGDKSSAFTSTLFKPEFFLEAGMAFATVNYRLSGEFPYQKQDEGDYPVQMEDVGIALQQLRHQAQALGVDSDRVVLVGRSAGGGISLWLGLHDDLASGDAGTQSSRSSRPQCVALFDTQTTLDIGEVESLIGPDGFALDAGLSGLYGIDIDDYATNAATIKNDLATSFAEASPITHLDTADADLRVIMSYGLPFDTGNIHSPEFGEYLGLGNPTATSEQFGRSSLASVGIEAPFLFDAPDFIQRRAVERFITEECFR